MSRRILTRTFPDPPKTWDESSQATWYRLVQILENSELFDKGRRTRPVFVVKGTVSAPVTLDTNHTQPHQLVNIVGKLLLALEGSNFVDIRREL